MQTYAMPLHVVAVLLCAMFTQVPDAVISLPDEHLWNPLLCCYTYTHFEVQALQDVLSVQKSNNDCLF
jgi:hypothetical protein